MSLDGIEVHLVDDINTAMEFKRWMSEDRAHVAVDTETSGLNPWTGNYTRLVQVGDVRTAWAVPFADWGGVVKEVLKDFPGRVLYHNAKFDMSFLQKDGVPVKWSQVDDTRTLAWLADPSRPTGLKSLCDRYVDSRASHMGGKLADLMSKNKWTWATVPVDLPDYWAYGCVDTILTCQLWEHLAPTLKSESTRMAYDLELSVLPVLQRMEQRGARVDIAYATARRREFHDRVDQWKRWATGAHGISLTSNQQVVHRMIAMGVELTKTTPGGALSMDKFVVEELLLHGNADVRQLALAKREVAQLLKLSSAYLDHFIDRSTDGRVHCNINPLGARTSRMTVKEPALQTLPRASAENLSAIEVRNCFIAQDGGSLAMVDYDQVELRLTGHFSQDAAMLAVLRDPDKDPFTEFARLIYKRPEIVKSDPERGLTKTATYATLYGAGAAKFAESAGISPAAGEAFMSEFYGTFPGLKTMKNAIDQVARRRFKHEGLAYVNTPYGHKIPADDGKEYKLVNYLCQATAANVMKQALVDLDNAGIGEYLVLPVHDEVILDAPDDMIHEVMRTTAQVMAVPDKFSVPLPVGVDGPLARWGWKFGKPEGVE